MPTDDGIPTEQSYARRMLELERQAYLKVVEVLADEEIVLALASWIAIRKVLRTLVDYSIATSGGLEVPAEEREKEGW